MLLSFSLTACGPESNDENQKNKQAPVVEKVNKEIINKPKTISKADEIKKAKKATATFAASLKSKLKNTMKAKGPVAAIDACNTKASEITAYVSNRYGLQLSRTSLKYRNKNNAPTDWQKVILKGFEAQKDKGADVKTIRYAEIIEENGKKQFRFMMPIPTQSLCLTCHGKNISASIKKRLKALYPEDKAIGFKEGDIRGAFVVINNL